jgi:uncharacterized membrane protein
MKLIRDNFILWAILFIALFLRIYDLGTESIWLDEGYTIRMAKLNLSQLIKDTLSFDLIPPLYHIFLHYWINLFGDSEFSTRFLSTIFGFFAVFMIYKVGSLFFNKNTGVLSSFLLALSLYHIKYSQEVRSYTLMVLLCLFSIYFFIRLFNKRTLTISIGYIISSSLLMYIHIYGLFIIIAQNIYLFTLFLLSKQEHKLNFRKWILSQIILFILYIPWISILVKQILRVQSDFWLPVPSILTVIETFGCYSSYSPSLLALFLILASFAIVSWKGVNDRFNWKKFFNSIKSYLWNLNLPDINKVYLLLLWLLTPIILPFIISQISTPIYNDRYTIASSLAFYILIARGIEKINNKFVKLIIIILVIGFSFAHIREYYTIVNNKEPWREVADYIDTNAKEGDLLLFNGGFCQENVFDYYSKRTDLIKKPFPKETRYIDEENIKELVPTVESYNRVWVILSHCGDEKGLIKRTLNKFYNLSYHKGYKSSLLSGREYVSIDLSLFIKK